MTLIPVVFLGICHLDVEDQVKYYLQLKAHDKTEQKCNLYIGRKEHNTENTVDNITALPARQ